MRKNLCKYVKFTLVAISIILLTCGCNENQIENSKLPEQNTQPVPTNEVPAPNPQPVPTNDIPTQDPQPFPIYKVHHPRLNDTGVDIWADLIANRYTSALSDFSGQDADFGRDFEARNGTLIKIGSGHAGFDFTKLDIEGTELLPDAVDWSCVRDNVTGLTWEIKTNDGGLRDKDNTFSWYNPDPSTNGNEPGQRNGGTCTGGIDCDTDSYVKAVNFAGLCGASDWRMPTKEELQSITDFGQLVVGIDTNFFPEIKHARYWSISTSAGDPANAWDVFFYNGSSYPDSSKYGNPPDPNISARWGWYVRLVHN